MHIIVTARSIIVLGPPMLELELTPWGLVVRDVLGRRIGMIRAVEG